MPPELSLYDVFTKEPYKSMMTLLSQFKEGLSLKEFQYCLLTNYKIKYSKWNLLEKFGEPDKEGKIFELISGGKLKRYEPKFKKKDPKTDKKVRIRNNIKNHLDRMKHHNWIYKDGMRYILKIEIFNDWMRHQNIEELMDYSNEQLLHYEVEPSGHIGEISPFHPHVIMYGFHPNILDEEANKKINIQFKKIVNIFFEINSLQTKKAEEYWKKLLEELKNNTESKKIRHLINSDKNERLGNFFDFFQSIFEKKSLIKEEFLEFTRAIFLVSKEEKQELAEKQGIWIQKFSEFKLNENEIQEISDFGWENKDFFKKIVNKNVAFSAYFGKPLS